jgi:XTP/dITP diphosphohydrolase
VVEGEILSIKRGQDGFGYDPIFLPACYTHTFAEMDLSLKNKISHRAKATGKLVEFLQKL